MIISKIQIIMLTLTLAPTLIIILILMCILMCIPRQTNATGDQWMPTATNEYDHRPMNASGVQWMLGRYSLVSLTRSPTTSPNNHLLHHLNYQLHLLQSTTFTYNYQLLHLLPTTSPTTTNYNSYNNQLHLLQQPTTSLTTTNTSHTTTKYIT